MAEKLPQPTAHPMPTSKPKKKGIATFLPLILVAVLAPASAWLTWRIVSKGTKKPKSETSAATEAAGHNSGPETKMKAEVGSPKSSNEATTIPLTRDFIGMHKRKYLGKFAVIAVNGDALREAEPDKLVVNVASTRGAQMIIARIFLEGHHSEMVDRVNQERQRLLSIVSDTLASKNLEEVSKPGFTSLASSELVNLFNDLLGPRTVEEVRFAEFEVRAR